MANPRLAVFIVNKLNRIRGKRGVGAQFIVPLQRLFLIGQLANRSIGQLLQRSFEIEILRKL